MKQATLPEVQKPWVPPKPCSLLDSLELELLVLRS